MTDQDAFVGRLRNELVSAGERQNRRKSRRIKTAVSTAVLAVIASVAGVGLVSAPSSAAALHIERTPQGLVVHLNNDKARSKQIAKELSKVGVTATVKEVPVAKPMEGAFVAFGGSDQSSLELLDSTAPSFDTFRIKPGPSAHVDLLLGRKANGGEHYIAAFDAWRPGGPMHCAAVIGHKVSEVGDRVSAMATSVEWQAFSGTGFQPVLPNSSGDLFVVDGRLTGASEMTVFLSKDPVAPTEGVAPIKDC